MLRQFSQHINTHFPFLEHKKVGIAISGGLDSVVLTHLLHRLKFTTVLAHCNFKLRGADADADEAFVKQFAKQLNSPVFTIAFNTKRIAKQEKLSIQLAARKLRYDWFEKLMDANEFDYILTAHHADDNLETFLINLSRGTGLDGLIGIPEINGKIIRPLLSFSREEIEKYAKENAIIWQEDQSNAETKYLRNKIRHQFIPLLKELNPSFLKSFQDTQAHLKDSRQLIDDFIRKTALDIVIKEVNGETKIDIKKLQQLNNSKAYLYELLKPYGFTEWDDIEDLLKAQSGKQIFSKTYRLVKDRMYLLLSKKEEEKRKHFRINKDVSVFENSDFKLIFSDFKIQGVIDRTQDTGRKTQDLIFIDMEKLKYPLIVRKWENGDYFYPFGMQGKKKLSKFFKDEKMSLLEKEKIWLLCSTNEIIWVIGKRLDSRFQITDHTKRILKIEMETFK